MTGTPTEATRRWRPTTRGLRRAAARVGAVGLLGVAALVALDRVHPPPSLELRPAARVVRDRDGRLLRVAPDPDQLCIPVPLAQMSPWLARATVAVEDQRFWRHGGVDGLAVLRAAAQNAWHRRRISGASTLTMQLARMAGGRARRWRAKLIETAQALQLERRHSKDALLAAYLNSAPYGGELYGVEAAARRYFGCSSRVLTLGQAALLAGLPQSPARLRPDRFPERARERRRRVLDAMLATGAIDGDAHARADAEPLVVRRHPMPFRAPHVCARVLARDAGHREIHVTLDLELQTRVARALRQHVRALRPRDVTGGAVLVYDTRAERVAAWVGSPDFDSPDAGQVDAVRARRSAGSTLKPLIYGLAYERGDCLPDEVLADVPRDFRGYAPDNFDREHLGLRPAAEHLAASRNVPAVTLLRRVGYPAVSDLLARLGFAQFPRSSEARLGLSLALGGGEVSLHQLARAYAMLARGGFDRPLRLRADAPIPPPVRVLSAGAAWMTADSLRRTARPLLGLATKTGTSWGLRDAWCVGFDDRWVIAVWLGNPDGRRSPALVGRDAALPLVARIHAGLRAAGIAGTLPERPRAVGRREVCATTGLAPGPACRQRRLVDVLPTSAARPCAIHRRVVRPAPDGTARTAIVERWPADVSAWLRRTTGPLAIRSPAQGAVYLLSEQAPGAPGIPLRATAACHWYLQGRYLGRSAGSPLLWRPVAGTHELVAVDARGRRASCRFVVLAR